MKTDVRIDWISATFEHNALRSDMMPDELVVAYDTEATPQRGYTWARKFVPYGVTESINPSRPEMGTHIVYSGQSLTRLAAASVSPLTILQKIRDGGGKVTRIDLALDVRDSGLKLAHMQESFENGEVVSNSRKITPMGRIRDSQGTLYIGSRTSEAFMRIYDKAYEQLRIGEDWLRIELELKGSKARKAHDALLSGKWGELIPSLIRGFCDWPYYEAWLNIFTVEPSIMVTDKRTGSDTRKWLMEQVAPALARYAVEQDTETLQQFNDEVISLVRKFERKMRGGIS